MQQLVQYSSGHMLPSVLHLTGDSTEDTALPINFKAQASPSRLLQSLSADVKATLGMDPVSSLDRLSCPSVRARPFFAPIECMVESVHRSLMQVAYPAADPVFRHPTAAAVLHDDVHGHTPALALTCRAVCCRVVLNLCHPR